jgi:hypothetical protein
MYLKFSWHSLTQFSNQHYNLHKRTPTFEVGEKQGKLVEGAPNIYGPPC